jgi:hypothetical protein
MSEQATTREDEDALNPSRMARFWLKQLPYFIVLALTILGVAYTSVSKQPLVGYWEFLALAMGIVCIGTGWYHAQTKASRFRIFWTQLLHWLAFQVAMNIVLLSQVQAMVGVNATSLVLLMLLALGTFSAGIHVSWQIAVLGLVMALFVPAIAWLQQSALFLVLGFVALAGVVATFWWSRSGSGKLEPSEDR